MTFRTRHRLPVALGHLSPVPRAWNLSPQFVSLFGPLPYVHSLSHLCLYVTYVTIHDSVSVMSICFPVPIRFRLDT